MGIFASIFKDRTNRQLFRKSIEKEYATYEAIKAEPELAPVSKKLGTRSIMFSVFTFLTVVLAVVGYYLLFTFFDPTQIFLGILIGIAIGVAAIVLVVLFFVKALYCLILQFRLNKKATTWVALGLLIVPALLFVAAIIIIIGFANGAK